MLVREAKQPDSITGDGQVNTINLAEHKERQKIPGGSREKVIMEKIVKEIKYRY